MHNNGSRFRDFTIDRCQWSLCMYWPTLNMYAVLINNLPHIYTRYNIDLGGDTCFGFLWLGLCGTCILAFVVDFCDWHLYFVFCDLTVFALDFDFSRFCVLTFVRYSVCVLLPFLRACLHQFIYKYQSLSLQLCVFVSVCLQFSLFPHVSFLSISL